MVGDEFLAQELLRSAALLVEIVENDDVPINSRGQNRSYSLYENLPDEVMAEDGWKILATEEWWIQKLGEDDIMSLQSKMCLKEYGLKVAA